MNKLAQFRRRSRGDTPRYYETLQQAVVGADDWNHCVVNVPISLLRVLECLNVSPESLNNPWFVCARQIVESSVQYEESALHWFYSNVKVANAAEYYGVGSQSPLSALSPGNVPLPWFDSASSGQNLRRILELWKNGHRLTVSADWPGIGPISDNGALQEFSRIRDVTRSMMRRGFFFDVHDPVRIQVLVGHNQDEVLAAKVISGGHRVCAASALGYQALPVVMRKADLWRCSLRDIKSWPGVSAGLFSATEARRVFSDLCDETMPAWYAGLSLC